MSVIENVSYGLRRSQLSRQVQRDKAREGLKMVGLEGYDDRLPSELSGGQQQRVAVARALVLEPQVLLFDEPLSNLDAKLRRRMREEIRDLQQTLGLTSVYVTHDQEEALAVSDKIVVMNKGRIAQVGTPHDLYERPAVAFVADFIGSANLISGNIKRRNEKDKTITIDLGNLILDVPDRGYEGNESILWCARVASASTQRVRRLLRCRRKSRKPPIWDRTGNTLSPRPIARCLWSSQPPRFSSRERGSLRRSIRIISQWSSGVDQIGD